MPTLDELRKTRIRKLETLKKKGIDPYPSKVLRDQTIADARGMDGKDVAVVGRILRERGHGKIVFFDLRDESGKVQIVVKEDVCDKNAFELTGLLDIGDFVAVQGTVGKTDAGEISVFATNLQMLSKSQRPLPDQWHGLTDIEERYRQRYVDIQMNPEVKQVFLTRSRIVKFLREYFDKHDFIEVETPVLQPIYGGAVAKPFVTHHNTLDVDLYLRIAVELYLKRLIVAGFERVYEIGKDFRNEGIDRGHNPEFTMLEFYWAYRDYEDLMKFTENMLADLVKTITGSLTIEYLGQKLDFTVPWKRVTYREAILTHTGIDIDVSDTEEKLKGAIKAKNITLEATDTVGYGALLDAFYKQTTRPKLVGPLFLTQRPTEFVSLAKRLPKDPRKTASFQLLVAGREIINAYNELNDPIDQAERWHESEKLGDQSKNEHEAFDSDYIRALEYGMPPTAGWGMGIDNLTAILTNQPALKDVILFPTLRPEKGMQKQKEEKRETPDLGISHVQAQKLLDEYIHDPVNRMHCRESEVIMQAVAKRLGYDAEKWGILGLLHDIDWELTKDNTKLHCITCVDILKNAGATEFCIKTIQSHGYGQGEFQDEIRVTDVQHALAASETVTGLVIATSLIQQDKKLASVKPESLVKKFKNEKFAAGCQRKIILECVTIGIPVDEFLKLALSALQEIHGELGL